MSDEENFLKAAKIAVTVKKSAKKFIKAGMPLLEIAERMEQEIVNLGGMPAFPVGLSINDIAAHYSPLRNDTKLAEGLLKVDFGAAVDGFPVDNAFSLDLTEDKRYGELVRASQEALDNALKIVKKDLEVREIGKEIENVIRSMGFKPIKNLYGHSIKRYNLHAGFSIPNYDNNNKAKFENGVYAIEPFASTGDGQVKEGKGSEIMMLVDKKPTRDLSSRRILDFIEREYKNLPFAARWITKRFGSISFMALQRLEKEGILYHYPQLIESSGGIVSQAEHSVLIMNDKIKVLTLEED